MEADLRVKLSLSDSKLVLLRADEDALHGRLTDLMERAKMAGAASMTIVTERKK